MISPAEIKALEEAVAALETQDEHRFCVRCGVELPVSDEVGNYSPTLRQQAALEKEQQN